MGGTDLHGLLLPCEEDGLVGAVPLAVLHGLADALKVVPAQVKISVSPEVATQALWATMRYHVIMYEYSYNI